MAVTITNVLAVTGRNMIVADVTATADADTTATIPHGLSAAPKAVSGTQLIGQALTALSAWAITTIDATNVVATKLTSTGSGNASPQYRVVAQLPHSLIS